MRSMARSLDKTRKQVAGRQRWRGGICVLGFCVPISYSPLLVGLGS